MFWSSSSKKGSGSSTPPSGGSSVMDRYRTASEKKAARDLELIDQLFYCYENKSTGIIEPDGIYSLCSELEVDHTDVRILMLAWKMQAKKQGYFTQDEWRKGLKAMRARTLCELQKALPDLEEEVRKPSNCADFYSYAFTYSLTEEKQKTIDIESICELLNLVLAWQFPSQVDAFTQYLKIQKDYWVLNMDQWMGFYRFCNEVNFPDLDNFDPESAWPVILDNFVDWLNSKPD